MTLTIKLREVRDADLPVLFEQQHDQVASRLAAFPSRQRDAFDAHWARIRVDPTCQNRIIEADGQVAGRISSFDLEGHREVGYWIGREFWGQGIASRALQLFLMEETQRPICGYVAEHNRASQRVLEKGGFVRVGEGQGVLQLDGLLVTEVIYRLE